MKLRQPGIAITGLGMVVVGGWVAATNLGAPLISFSRIWPAVLAILGLAMLTQNAVRGRQGNGLLLLGTMVLMSGIFLCAFTLEIGGLAWPDMAGYWPVFPLIVGVSFLLVYLTGNMQEQPLLIPIYLFGGFALFALPITLGIIRGAFFTQVVRLSPLLLILIVMAVLLQLRSQSKHGDTE